MGKYQKLSTVKQIVEAVNEKNLDCFISDFKMFLKLQIATRNVDIQKELGIKGVEIAQIEMGKVFHWCDDGTPGLSGVTIEIKNISK